MCVCTSLCQLLGAPLVGSDLRAYILSGGHFRIRPFLRPKFASRRIHMIFPIRGPEGKGIVSLEAKKKVNFPLSKYEI